MRALLAFILFLHLHSSSSPRILDQKELFCLSQVVYHEARGEPILGQVAVAHVVLNRVKSPLFPKTICKVVHQPGQFSYIEYSKPDYNSEQWKVAVEVAVLSYSGYLESPVRDAKFYYCPRKVSKPKHWPSIYVGTIGEHKFYDTTTKGKQNDYSRRKENR